MSNATQIERQRIDGLPLREVMRELATITGGKASRWRKAGEFVGVAYLPDGTIEAGGNDSEQVARAILKAVSCRKLRRSASAQKAAETRARRTQAQVYEVARMVLAGRHQTPSLMCRICRKLVTDPVSRSRGIGPDCWGQVLAIIEELTTSERSADNGEIFTR